jgi:hypothetical protein
MKSSECAAWNCNRAIGLFSHFADRLLKIFPSGGFKSQSKRTASLHNSKKELEFACIVRIADISFGCLVENWLFKRSLNETQK